MVGVVVYWFRPERVAVWVCAVVPVRLCAWRLVAEGIA